MGRSEVLQGLHLGDDSAERDARFAEIVVLRRESAVRLAWRLLGGDAAAAEDVAQDAENLCDARGHRALRCLHEQQDALSSECAEALDKLSHPHHCRHGKGEAEASGCGRSGLHGPGVTGVEQGA